MSLRINDIAPDFTADTTQGPISFHEWIGSGWAVLFSHPKNFTPVCTTELGAMAGLAGEFSKRGAKVIGISVDPVESHAKWKNDIKTATGFDVEYPLIGDKDLKVAKLYDMLPAGAGESSEGRTPADNATVRSVFIIGPDKKIKLILTYPMTTGRNFNEILRAIDSIQLTGARANVHPSRFNMVPD
ncbi:redoxin domain-containing protein, partial [Rhizobium johnstonii]